MINHLYPLEIVDDGFGLFSLPAAMFNHKKAHRHFRGKSESLNHSIDQISIGIVFPRLKNKLS